MGDIIRCEWPGTNPLDMEYHDKEWGKQVKDDRVMFEFLILEGAQAGLSWATVLQRREGYHRAFHNFDVQKVARMSAADIEDAIANGNIIRNRLKVVSTVNNAKLFIDIQREFGSFCNYLKGFFPGGVVPIINHPATLSDVPATSDISDAISRDMKRRGFKFFGSTICYAFLQAVGYVNDHVESCSFKMQ